MNMENNNSMKNKIISQIKKGDIHMRPKIQFTLQTILVIVGIVVFGLALVYFISFTSFIFKINGIWNLPSFGAMGIMPFLHSLPWLLFVLILVFLITLEILTQYFSFSHKVPLIYTLIAIITIGVIGGTFIISNSFHDHTLMRAKENNAPFVGGMYNRYTDLQSDNIFKATVLNVGTSSLSVVLYGGETVEIVVSDATHIPKSAVISKGVDIMVIGEKDGSIIYAEGIRSVKLYRNNEVEKIRINHKDSNFYDNDSLRGFQKAQVMTGGEDLQSF